MPGLTQRAVLKAFMMLVGALGLPNAAAAQAVRGNDAWPLTVIVVDESGSMKHRDAPQWLQDHLMPDSGSVNIMYGLVAFAEQARVIDSDAGTLWPSTGLAAGFANLDLTHGLEDGLAAVRFAMKEFGVFPDAAQHYLLVSDEDRDIVHAEVDVDSLADELAAAGAVVDAMISISLRCGGKRALGLTRGGMAYVADGAGGFRTCEGGFVQQLASSPVNDYALLALGSGGMVWDIGMTGWRVEGKHYPPLDSHRRRSAVAAYEAAAGAQWQRRLREPLVASARLSRIMTSVGGVVELDASASYSREPARELVQFDWLVDGVPVTAGEKAVVVAEKAGPMQVTLRVTDGGFPPRTSEDRVTVWVSD